MIVIVLMKKKRVKKKINSLNKKSKKKHGFTELFYGNFISSIKDLGKIKNYFLFSLILFILIAVIGFFYPVFFQEQVLNVIKDLIKQTEGLGSVELTGFIIFNNLKSSFFGIIFGIFLGIVPLGIIIVNGYVLGFVANKTVEAGGIFILWRLFPHGIFEIPAVIISVGAGLMIGISFIKDCILFFNKKISKFNLYFLILISIIFFPISFIIALIFNLKYKILRKKLYFNLKIAFKIFLFIVIPLLVIAGLIEGLLIYLLG